MRYRWDACGPRVKFFFSFDLVDSLAECGWAIHLFLVHEQGIIFLNNYAKSFDFIN